MLRSRVWKSEKTTRSIEWPHKKTLRFIELYKTHQNLWDKQHEFFGKLENRRNSIDEISAELEVSPHEVASKMIQVKGIFRDCWLKNRKSAWKYFTAMKFLAKNYPNVEKACGANGADNGEAVLDQFYVDEEDDVFIACGSQLKPSTAVSCTPCNKPIKREPPEPVQPTPAPAAVAPTIDATDDFFRAMAAIVKGFPRKQVVEIRSKISELVNNMDLTLAMEQ